MNGKTNLKSSNQQVSAARLNNVKSLLMLKGNPMKKKEYRYSNYLDGRVISESDWLLQSSNFKGQIRDNLRKKFIPPIPHPIPSLWESFIEEIKRSLL